MSKNNNNIKTNHPGLVLVKNSVLEIVAQSYRAMVARRKKTIPQNEGGLSLLDVIVRTDTTRVQSNKKRRLANALSTKNQ